MVILKTDKGKAASRAAQSLIDTLLILLATDARYDFISSGVLRARLPIFPMRRGSIADGDLSRACDRARNGRTKWDKLASQFNEMTARA